MIIYHDNAKIGEFFKNSHLIVDNLFYQIIINISKGFIVYIYQLQFDKYVINAILTFTDTLTG